MIPTDEMVNRFLRWRLPSAVCADQCATVAGYAGHRTGTNLLTADQAYEMLEFVLEDPDAEYNAFHSDHDAAILFERTAYHLMQMMQAYERRVRSDCKSEAEIAQRPWECLEYKAAATFLRRHWQDVPVGGQFVGTAWLIELVDAAGHCLYYCSPGQWCNNANHALKFPSEEACRASPEWRDMVEPGNMRIAAHEWVP